jgi:hypothetical protein
MSPAPTPMTPGKNYRVIYQLPGVQKKPREAVMTFLGHNAELVWKKYTFSLRPLSGTTELDTTWVREIWSTQRPVMTPRIFRGARVPGERRIL